MSSETPKKSFSLPRALAKRLEKHRKEAPTWAQINVSAVCAEAIDKALSEKGY